MLGRAARVGGAFAAGIACFSQAYSIHGVRERLERVFEATFPVATLAPSTNGQQPKILNPAFGYPLAERIIHRNGYTVSYDARLRTARWVYEHLTADTVAGDASRENEVFVEEKSIPREFRARLKDYTNSGYDRGHLAPAADMRGDQDAMRDTFALGNVIPQNPELNRRYWSRVEGFVRHLTRRFDHVHVYTGPLYLPKRNGDKWVVTYEVLGDSQIAVPTHIFKVILVQKQLANGSAHHYVAALVIPNEPVDDQTPLISFLRPLDMVERAVGTNFFPDLRRSGLLLALPDAASSSGDKPKRKKSKPKPPPPAPAAAPLCDNTECKLPPPGFWLK